MDELILMIVNKLTPRTVIVLKLLLDPQNTTNVENLMYSSHWGLSEPLFLNDRLPPTLW